MNQIRTIKNSEILKKKNSKLVFQILRSIVLLAIFPIATFAANPPVIPDGWTDGFAYVNGVRIHYYNAVPAPEKPVIVMAHGVTDNGLCWTTLAWKLQKDYNLFILDTRGHGLSDPIKSTDDGETLVKDIVGFVEAMNFEKPIIMGHSMGAATVMRVGAEYPNLAKAVIMLDPFLVAFNRDKVESEHKTPPDHSKKKTNEIPQSKNNKQKNLSVNMFGDPNTLVAQNNYDFNELVAKAHHDNPKWDSVDCQYWALSKKQYHGPYSDAAWKAMHGTMRTDGALAKITVKSLVLKADASPEVRKANEEAVKGLEKVKLVHIDGAAHNLHHDELERTIKEITDFLLKL